MCACAGRITVRRNHASVAAPKSAGHGEIFFSKAICLALVTMACQLLTRISDGSSRRSAINFAGSNQDTSKLTPPNFRKTSSGNR